MSFVGGKLKLKGGDLPATGGVKKKKRKSSGKAEDGALIALSGEGADGATGTAALTANQKREGYVLPPRSEDEDRRTEAEKRHDEKVRKLEEERLRKMAGKGYRDRVKDFNEHLANLSAVKAAKGSAHSTGPQPAGVLSPPTARPYQLLRDKSDTVKDMIMCDGSGVLVGSLEPAAAQLEVEARFLGIDLFMLAIEAAKAGMLAAKATMQDAMDARSKDKLDHVARHALKLSHGLPPKKVTLAPQPHNDNNNTKCLETIAFDQLYDALMHVEASGTANAKAAAPSLSIQLKNALREELQVVGVELDADDSQLGAELLQVFRYRQRRNGPAAHPLDPKREAFEEELSLVARAIAIKHPIIMPITHMVQLGVSELRRKAPKKAQKAGADEWEGFN